MLGNQEKISRFCPRVAQRPFFDAKPPYYLFGQEIILKIAWPIFTMGCCIVLTQTKFLSHCGHPLQELECYACGFLGGGEGGGN